MISDKTLKKMPMCQHDRNDCFASWRGHCMMLTPPLPSACTFYKPCALANPENISWWRMTAEERKEERGKIALREVAAISPGWARAHLCRARDNGTGHDCEYLHTAEEGERKPDGRKSVPGREYCTANDRWWALPESGQSPLGVCVYRPNTRT